MYQLEFNIVGIIPNRPLASQANLKVFYSKFFRMKILCTYGPVGWEMSDANFFTLRSFSNLHN